MADVSAIFGILLLLAIVFPGLLTALWLLFPATVERARLRLDRTPWQCFWLGGVLTAFITVPIVILLALGVGPTQFLAWALMVITLALASIGAAGLAAKMAERLSQNSTLSRASAFVRGAVTLELAAGVPVIGWFIFLPLALVLSLGATAFALLRWVPRSVTSEQFSVNGEPLAKATH